VSQQTFEGFSKAALEELDGSGASPLRSIREEAFGAFERLPMPSPETEEWRYTDLRDLDLRFVPFAFEPAVTTLEEVKPDVLPGGGAAARAGLSIQHNSTVVVTHVEPDVRRRGVLFTSLDEAIERHWHLVDPHLHRAVPTARTRFTALHAAYRTGGTAWRSFRIPCSFWTKGPSSRSSTAIPRRRWTGCCRTPSSSCTSARRPSCATWRSRTGGRE
jgi:Fe-S cluster assembly protein SufD